MKKAHLIGMLLMSAVIGAFAAAASGVDSAAWERRLDPKDVERARLQKNKRDFLQLRVVDSVGWEKVKAIKRPDETMDELQKERLARKTSSLTGFCNESRFSKIAELDSIKDLTKEERAFCRERLVLVNPLIPEK